MNKKEFPFSVKIKPDVEYAYGKTILVSRIYSGSNKIYSFHGYTVKSHSETTRARARKWAIENANHKWCVGSKYIHFSNKTDAALFTIFWENDNER